jgi:membrane associated rhomboid family serine protease
MVAVPDGLPIQQVAVLLSVAVALVVVYRLDGDAEWVATLRRRFVMGVPWGTLTVLAGVLAVYLLLQDGLSHWYRPVTIPFRAWSYFYPLGMVTSPFAHLGPNHLVGNLVGTLAFASVAEYAYGHFPRRRGASSFATRRSNPYVRAFVVVPAVTAATGLVVGAFSIGPVIGFSGVVFAFAGFALVYYPLTTVLVSVGSRAVDLFYRSLLNPQSTVESRTVFVTPWFADIALQTHALGFLVGVLGGLWLQSHRGEARPDARRVWLGAVVLAVTSSFWAVYWFRGNGTFVLYRAIGFVLVVGLALVVTSAVSGPSRPLRARVLADGAPDRLRDADGLREALAAASVRQVAAVLIVVGAAGLAGPAVPVNLATAASGDLPGETVTVRDYQVTYAENVPNGMVSVVDVEAFGESTTVNASGVLVQSQERGIWMQTVPKGRLALRGRVPVRLGGVGWRAEVVAQRTGWKVVGTDPAYRVQLHHGDRTVTAYTTPPRRAEPLLAGQNVSVLAEPDGFYVTVGAGENRARAAIPATNETTTMNGVTFSRTDGKLFATVDETRVRVASVETYKR